MTEKPPLLYLDPDGKPYRLSIGGEFVRFEVTNYDGPPLPEPPSKNPECDIQS